MTNFESICSAVTEQGPSGVWGRLVGFGALCNDASITHKLDGNYMGRATDVALLTVTFSLYLASPILGRLVVYDLYSVMTCCLLTTKFGCSLQWSIWSGLDRSTDWITLLLRPTRTGLDQTRPNRGNTTIESIQ
jgi:hypothetical protein